ncbi:hypothetical protein GR268_44075, partial [Rhizobium leguminosarum]|nr:hypothetical protein [Rhizobium leguminosarum]
GVRRALLKVGWPEALMGHPGAGRVVFDADDRQQQRQVVFKGLRVRMGLHAGSPKVVRDPMTSRVDYGGPVVDAAARITAMAHGGQVVLSRAVYDELSGAGTDAKARTQRLGKHVVGRSTKGKRMHGTTRTTHTHRTRTHHRSTHTIGCQVPYSVGQDVPQVGQGRAFGRAEDPGRL